MITIRPARRSSGTITTYTRSSIQPALGPLGYSLDDFARRRINRAGDAGSHDLGAISQLGVTPHSFNVAYEVADGVNLIEIVIRDFHANEPIFDHDHQFQAVEPVGAEVISEVRFLCDTLDVDAELLGNQSADCGGKAFPRSLSRCQVIDGHDNTPQSERISASDRAIRPTMWRRSRISGMLQKSMGPACLASPASSANRVGDAEKADHRHRRLSLARRKRPRGRRAAEQRDELPPSHAGSYREHLCSA